MTAQVYFNLWRKPTKLEIIAQPTNEGCLGQVHFGGDGLHPVSIAFFIQEAHSSRVAGKRLVREGVNLEQWDGHCYFTSAYSFELRN